MLTPSALLFIGNAIAASPSKPLDVPALFEAPICASIRTEANEALSELGFQAIPGSESCMSSSQEKTAGYRVEFGTQGAEQGSLSLQVAESGKNTGSVTQASLENDFEFDELAQASEATSAAYATGIKPRLALAQQCQTLAAALKRAYPFDSGLVQVVDKRLCGTSIGDAELSPVLDNGLGITLNNRYTEDEGEYMNLPLNQVNVSVWTTPTGGYVSVTGPGVMISHIQEMPEGQIRYESLQASRSSNSLAHPECEDMMEVFHTQGRTDAEVEQLVTDSVGKLTRGECPTGKQ